MEQINMFEEMYDKLPIWNKELKICELYGGIGSQRKALTRLGIKIKSSHLVDVDIDATISYAAIYHNLEKEIKIFKFPKKQIMINELDDIYVLNGITFYDKELKRHSKIKHNKKGYAFPGKVKSIQKRRKNLTYKLNWWRNDEAYDIRKLKNDKLKQLYLSQKLSKNLGNVFNLTADDIPKVDLITWSTPCQDFSLAGKQKGFDGKKGGLTFITLELFKGLKRLNKLPTFLLFENVPALISKKFIHGFNVMRTELRDLGYENITLILNAKDYEIPQNRKRVFILSIKKEYLEGFRYDSPKPHALKQRLKDMLEEIVDERYFLTDNQLKHIMKNGKWNCNPSGKGIGGNINIKNIANTITTNKGEGQKIALYDFNSSNKRLGNKSRIKKDVKIMNTVLTEPRTAIIQINKPKHSNNRVYHENGISPTINTMQGGNRQPFIAMPEATKKGYAEAKDGDGVYINRPYQKRGVVQKEMIQTLKTGQDVGVVVNPLKGKTNNGWHFEQQVYDENGITRTIKAGGGSGNIPKVIQQLTIRKLTPKECWRLMGFDDVDYEKAKLYISDSQLYKQAGNSIVVNVLEAIFKELLLGGKDVK